MSVKTFDRFRNIAAAEGYEMVHAESSSSSTGKDSGLIILVRLSERRVMDDWRVIDERDASCVFRAADALKRGFETVSAQLDPEADAKREAQRQTFEGIYKTAGVEAIYMEPLPNGYCPEPCCLNRPWFRVTSRIGHVVIGWRKSVISIDWKDTILVEKDGEKLFPSENVTRLETGIHAWGVEKAAEYIRRLHEVAR